MLTVLCSVPCVQPEFISFGPAATFAQPQVNIGMLTVDTPYEFRVYAGNDYGWSAAAVLPAAVAPTDPPQRPTGVRLLSFNQTSATIAWSMPAESPPATLYQVMLRQCRVRDGLDVCDEFQAYRMPGADAALEVPGQQVQLVGLTTNAVYQVAVLARNLNVAGYSYVPYPPALPLDTPPLNVCTRQRLCPSRQAQLTLSLHLAVSPSFSACSGTAKRNSISSKSSPGGP